MRVERPLVLEIDRREPRVGKEITVRVRDRSNRPVEDAIVEAGSKRVRTDHRGRCTLTLRTPGFWKILATKPPTGRVAYEPATALIRVVPGRAASRSGRRINRGLSG
ncbi:carboxypeptidase regulatory-like domain-containing protein [Natrarchaeobius chitinivorans]|uniref:Carboxypeptidase regulatory-like domain-containing protein n=1 Tax=Natrarchaeobius chitinivorans TaxID=1679083 RepID=A0A3N6MIZ2_NATCH|nr:carboxypeptidase regulatory-like domain-containing protein [Natrarchaeobius chitinivorans]RQG96980.1 carboxypeptidase regulatory-like domain-containing protein [Natrarchaeobius chitinivorans]